MEQYTEYLMWVKSKDLIMNSFNHSTSWEEQAFAEDARGPLGGFVWPPRSYPCSFCKREFRSAQALGGHMNIHRRERARLKQSHPNIPQSTLSKSLESSQNPSTSFVASSDISPPGISLSPITLGQESFSSSNSEWVLSHEHNNVETGLFMGGINLDFWGNSNSNPVDVDQDEDMVANCKRQKTTVLSLMTSSKDGIDLELRLGDSSKVK